MASIQVGKYNDKYFFLKITTGTRNSYHVYISPLTARIIAENEGLDINEILNRPFPIINIQHPDHPLP